MARPGASTHVERREPKPGTDPRISKIERTDRVRGVREEREVRVGAGTEGAEYGELSKPERGVVRTYLEKVTGMSVSQMTRLIRAFLDQGVVQAVSY